jgi:hypothetical protein
LFQAKGVGGSEPSGQYVVGAIPFLLHFIYYQYFQNIYSNFLELNHEEKLGKIINPSTPEQIRTVTSFIRQSLELREGDSSQS